MADLHPHQTSEQVNTAKRYLGGDDSVIEITVAEVH